MTTEEAKFILQAYRSDQDPKDFPELEDALKLLEDDPELQSWLDEEMAFDEAFASKLNEIEVPENLGTRILRQVVCTTENVVEIPWWKQFSTLGAAAAIALVLALVLLPIRRDPVEGTIASVQSFQDFASDNLKFYNVINSQSQDWGALVKYLQDHETPAPTKLPGKIQNMTPAGCMTLQLNEKPIGAVCFGKDSKSRLFVIESKDFPQMPVQTNPITEQSAFATSVYWSDKERHYLLLSHDPKKISQYVSF